MELEFCIVNVFTVGDDPFSGNPLAVFPDAAALDDRQMQALARQLNLSETAFVTTPVGPDGRAVVRIFTPAIEMTFAGHPTLGTASVLGARTGRDDVVLVEPAGDIAVRRIAEGWQLDAKPGTVNGSAHSVHEVAEALGIAAADIVGEPDVVDAGSAGLVVIVRDEQVLAACRPNPAGLERVAQTPDGEPRVYVVTASVLGSDTATARMFYGQDGVVLEDPATGSQCANLGTWLASRGATGTWRVAQGAATGRPSELVLTVDGAGVHVAGRVRPVAVGRWTL